MIQATVRAWLQTTFVLVLITVPLGPVTKAQEAPQTACPVYSNVCAGSFVHNSLLLAQLDEQPDRSGYGEGRDRRFDHGRKGLQHKFGKHIEQFRILKLLELLDLREDQELEFITAFQSMRRERRQLHEKRISLVDELADGLRTETVPDMEINRLIREISKLGNQQERVMEDFLSEAQKILTPSQLGRFIVFRERFEFELLEAVKAFRERQPPPGKLPPMEEPGR